MEFNRSITVAALYVEGCVFRAPTGGTFKRNEMELVGVSLQNLRTFCHSREGGNPLRTTGAVRWVAASCEARGWIFRATR
jgi:hypothetical protein